MDEKIWFEAYDLYPAGPVKKARFDEEDDAREYVELLREKYPTRKYVMLSMKDGGWTFLPE